MKILRSLFASILLQSATAAPVVVERNLAEIGFVRAERLAGTTVERDFFFPLPSRDFLVGTSSFQVVLKTSPFLDPGSVVTILVNERPVATKAVGEDGSLTISAAIPAEVKADDPTSQVLKLTVRGALALRDEPAASGDILRETSWIDVRPETKFVCSVDPADPDWLAVGRLAATLGPTVTIRLPGPGDPVAAELALRAATWAAHAQPFGRVTVAAEPPEVGDEIVIEIASGREAGIAVAAGPNGRVITLSAADAVGAAALWEMLIGAGQSVIPGDEMSAVADAAGADEAEDPTTLRALDPRIGELNRGPGDTERKFSFAPARLGASPGRLILDLAGRMSDLSGFGPMVGAVFLNDQLVHSVSLDPASPTFIWSVALPAEHLRGESEVRVVMIPGDPSKPYFWQLEETLAISAGGGSPAPATGPSSLLEAAQRSFAGGPYDVVLGAGGTLEVAASVAIWLQRVNRTTRLEPRLTERPDGNAPTVVIGELPADLDGVADTLPIAIDAGQVTVRGDGGREVLRVASDESLSYWQLGSGPDERPVIVAGSSGPDGPAALAAMSGQVAAARWIEAGDVIVGDGSSPVLTMSTRDPGTAEAPTATVAAEEGIEIVSAGPGGVIGDWRQWRWWAVGGLWLALSGTIFFVYKQGRQHAR